MTDPCVDMFRAQICSVGIITDSGSVYHPKRAGGAGNGGGGGEQQRPKLFFGKKTKTNKQKKPNKWI